MKNLKLSIVVISVLAALCSASAWSSEFSLKPSYFYLTDSSARDIAGNGLGLTVEQKVGSASKLPIYASAGIYRFSNDFDLLGDTYNTRMTLIPVFLNTKLYSMNKKTYCGFGMGFIYSDVKIDNLSNNNTDLAFQLLGGLEINDGYSLELKYLDGDRNGNTGLSFNLGMRF